MAIRQRAIHSEDKHERHNAILDATAELRNINYQGKKYTATKSGVKSA